MKNTSPACTLRTQRLVISCAKAKLLNCLDLLGDARNGPQHEKRGRLCIWHVFSDPLPSILAKKLSRPRERHGTGSYRAQGLGPTTENNKSDVARKSLESRRTPGPTRAGTASHASGRGTSRQIRPHLICPVDLVYIYIYYGIV